MENKWSLALDQYLPILSLKMDEFVELSNFCPLPTDDISHTTYVGSKSPHLTIFNLTIYEIYPESNEINLLKLFRFVTLIENQLTNVEKYSVHICLSAE